MVSYLHPAWDRCCSETRHSTSKWLALYAGLLQHGIAMPCHFSMKLEPHPGLGSGCEDWSSGVSSALPLGERGWSDPGGEDVARKSPGHAHSMFSHMATTR